MDWINIYKIIRYNISTKDGDRIFRELKEYCKTNQITLVRNLPTKMTGVIH